MRRQGVRDVVDGAGLVRDEDVPEVDVDAGADLVDDDDPAAVMAVDVVDDDEGGAGDAEQPESAATQTARTAAALEVPAATTPDEEVTVDGMVFRRSEVGDARFSALKRFAENANTWRGQAQHWGKLVEERTRQAAEHERAQARRPAPQPPTREQIIAAGKPHFERLKAMGVEPEIEAELPGLAAHLGLGMHRIDRLEATSVRLLQVLCAAEPELLDAFADLGLPEGMFEPVMPVITQTREGRARQREAAFGARYRAAVDRLIASDELYAGLADPATRKEFDAMVVAEFEQRRDDPFAMSDERLEDELERLLLKRQKKTLLEASRVAREAAAKRQGQATTQATSGTRTGRGGATTKRQSRFADIEEVLDS